MAYTSTELRKAISKASGTIFQDAEMRELQRGALGVFKANEPKVFQNAKLIKKAQSQPTTATLFVRDYTASGTSISANHSGDLGGTIEKSITFNPLTQEIDVSHKLAQKNQMSLDEILKDKLHNALLNLYRDENKMITDWLALNKTQVTAGNGLMDWDAVGFVYENKLANKDKIGLRVQAMMRQNKYNGNYDVIADQFLNAQLTDLGYNGVGNASNTQAQLNGLTTVEEVTIANTTYDGFGYVSMKGMVGMTSWLPQMNIEGAGDINGVGGLYTTMIDPVYGGLLGVHIKRRGADTQAQGGEAQDLVDNYQIFRFSAVGAAFISTANESPIFAVGQLNA